MNHKREIGLRPQVRAGYLWSMTPNEPRCSGQEFESVCQALDQVISQEKRDRKLKMLDLYLLGDFFEERTQYLMVSSTSFLRVQLLRHIQRFLRRPETENWRVVIIIQNVGSAVIVYSEALFYEEKRVGSPSELRASIMAQKPGCNR